MQERTCFIRTAPSLSENLPRCKISSKSSPPLQILRQNLVINECFRGYLLGDEIVSLVILEELVHLDDVGVILDKRVMLSIGVWIKYLCSRMHLQCPPRDIILINISSKGVFRSPDGSDTQEPGSDSSLKSEWLLTISLRMLISLKSMRFSSSSM